MWFPRGISGVGSSLRSQIWFGLGPGFVWTRASSPWSLAAAFARYRRCFRTSGAPGGLRPFARSSVDGGGRSGWSGTGGSMRMLGHWVQPRLCVCAATRISACGLACGWAVDGLVCIQDRRSSEGICATLLGPALVQQAGDQGPRHCRWRRGEQWQFWPSMRGAVAVCAASVPHVSQLCVFGVVSWVRLLALAALRTV